MIDTRVWSMAWKLLDTSAKREAIFVICVCGLAALSSVLMVSSVLPFLMVLANTDQISTNYSLAKVYEIGGFSSSYWFLVALGLGTITAIVISNALQVLRSWAVARFSYMQIYALSKTLMTVYLQQPYEYFLDRNSADINTKILSESQEAVNQFFRPAGELVAALLTALMIVVFIVWLYPSISILIFGVLASIYWIIHVISRRSISHAGHFRAEKNRARFQITQEAFAGIKEIKLLGCERHYIDGFSDAAEKMSRKIVFIQIVGEIPQYLMQAVGFGGLILIAILLLDPVQLASGDTLNNILPTLGLFAFAGQKLLPELSRIHNCLTKLNASSAAVEALSVTLSETSNIPSQPLETSIPLKLENSLTLADVTYRYPFAATDTLDGVSVRIYQGEKIGVIGTTGAGKTTFVDVILGLLKPVKGQMIVDDVLITEENIHSWQKSIGYVPQDIFLTDASVAENIAFGVLKNSIDRERIRYAARVANIDRFVEHDLPSGYETVVGERGTRLSGGQRQRIGIARALYHDSDLIIFDEATSALDSQTESQVMEAINTLPRDRTIILIAHRLRTIKQCDKIIFLNNGRIEGFGNWVSLSKNNEIFQNFINKVKV